MSQTNTDTNTGAGNTNRNQITGRGWRGHGGPDGRGHGGRGGDRGNISIAKYSFEGKMKDGCISKLTIIETGHWATQYKKIIDTIPVFCADKNFRYIDDVLRTWTNLQEVTFLPPYPDSDRWSNTYSVEIKTVDLAMASDTVTGECPVIISFV